MIIEKDIVINKNIVDKVICNCCGKEIERNSHGYLNDYIHIEKQWGYTSNKDGESQNVDICEKCWDKILAGFKLK